MLGGGQAQTFDGLPDKEVTVLDTLKIKLTEPQVLELSRLQEYYIVDTEALTCRLGATCYRSSLMEPIEKLENGAIP